MNEIFSSTNQIELFNWGGSLHSLGGSFYKRGLPIARGGVF